MNSNEGPVSQAYERLIQAVVSLKQLDTGKILENLEKQLINITQSIDKLRTELNNTLDQIIRLRRGKSKKFKIVLILALFYFLTPMIFELYQYIYQFQGYFISLDLKRYDLRYFFGFYYFMPNIIIFSIVLLGAAIFRFNAIRREIKIVKDINLDEVPQKLAELESTKNKYLYKKYLIEKCINIVREHDIEILEAARSLVEEGNLQPSLTLFEKLSNYRCPRPGMYYEEPLNVWSYLYELSLAIYYMSFEKLHKIITHLDNMLMNPRTRNQIVIEIDGHRVAFYLAILELYYIYAKNLLASKAVYAPTISRRQPIVPAVEMELEESTIKRQAPIPTYETQCVFKYGSFSWPRTGKLKIMEDGIELIGKLSIRYAPIYVGGVIIGGFLIWIIRSLGVGNVHDKILFDDILWYDVGWGGIGRKRVKLTLKGRKVEIYVNKRDVEPLIDALSKFVKRR